VNHVARIIARGQVDAWLARILVRAEVIAPTSGPAGDEMFARVTSPEDVLWQFRNPLYPPKQFLIPQTDPVARFRKEDGRFRVEAAGDAPERILLNIRSCDVSGLAFVREMHARDLPDEAILRRAANLTLVSLACTTPCPWGFCICCDAGPFLERDYDLQLTDLGDHLFAEVGSDRGRALVDLAADLFEPATEDDVARRRAAEEAACRNFADETCHFASAMRRISTRRVAEGLWQAMSPWCLECGGCNHVCPTCYCFSVSDLEEGEDAWLRCRLWDSCQYAAFTLEASGHNPRPSRAERMKRRFYHKVSAQYYARDGRLGCVGCGRCIRVCMGTTDMPSVVAAIRKGTWEGGRAYD
jgi:sulfhydrogenase subunit beta (sulfur reductase)